MSKHQTRRPIVPAVEILEAREVPAATPWSFESFESIGSGLPAGWSQWSSSATASFAASASRALTGVMGVATSGASNTAARAWLDARFPADFGVRAAIYLDSLVPVQLFVRGQNLSAANASYYALTVTRGLELQLLRVQDGQATILSSLKSTSYFSVKWIQATLSPEGDRLRVEIFRPDANQYLSATGQWQSARTWALDVPDAALSAPGQIGLARMARYAGPVTMDDFTILGPNVRDNFDSAELGKLPDAWSQWSSSGAPTYAVATGRSLTGTQSLATSAASNVAGRAWFSAPLPADVQVSAAIYVDSLIPTQLLVRGTNLETTPPSYYALSLTRGLDVQLLRVASGSATVLGSVRSSDYVSVKWIQATFYANGDSLRGRIFRTDTSQYLDDQGQWTSVPVWALQHTDTALAHLGYVGLNRPALHGGSVYVDDFQAVAVSADNQAPAVRLTSPIAGSEVKGAITVAADAQDAGGIDRVEFWLDGALRSSDAAAPFTWLFDSTNVADGAHTLEARAFDRAGNFGSASAAITVKNDEGLPRPSIPRHYSHIRIAQLAYFGTPFSAFEDKLLRESVDLVIPNPNFLSRIDGVAPATPQLLYTNLSNLYQELLTNWLNYADRNSLDREAAFYHAANALAYSGSSASSQPVTWFWSVLRGGATLSDLTSAARHTATPDVAFAGMGEAVFVGYPERFREINLNLVSGAAGGWRGVLEYASAVDANGRPTAWTTLPVLSDDTAGLTRSGRILFDPPSDWKTATIGNRPARLFYVRFRTTAAGTAPVARTILGRDYVAAGAGPAGVIPSFDAAVDANRDGYLTDAEYAGRAAGRDARFVYESRVFYPGYGAMRFATNPANVSFRRWTADFMTEFLDGQPLADGAFIDNAKGRAPVTAAQVQESIASYATDHAAMLAEIGQKIAPRWLLANTAGGGVSADAVVQRGIATFEEFAIRPLAHTYVHLEDLMITLRRRANLRSPAPYVILDSYPTGGSPTDPRTQTATLAYYYLLADPESTFLMYFGGYEPSSSWTRHWSAATAYNVGQPIGSSYLFASGSDPSDSRLTYKVYGRVYDNALVLYKPRSYNTGQGTGTLADNTATTHNLGGTYRILAADGTLGGPVTSVSLRNGEGMVLVRA